MSLLQESPPAQLKGQVPHFPVGSSLAAGEMSWSLAPQRRLSCSGQPRSPLSVVLPAVNNLRGEDHCGSDYSACKHADLLSLRPLLLLVWDYPQDGMAAIGVADGGLYMVSASKPFEGNDTPDILVSGTDDAGAISAIQVAVYAVLHRLPSLARVQVCRSDLLPLRIHISSPGTELVGASVGVPAFLATVIFLMGRPINNLGVGFTGEVGTVVHP